jgi:hypothetical protein
LEEVDERERVAHRRPFQRLYVLLLQRLARAKQQHQECGEVEGSGTLEIELWRADIPVDLSHDHADDSSYDADAPGEQD